MIQFPSNVYKISKVKKLSFSTKKFVGNFQLKNTIGKGTFGKVKLAKHKQNNQLVAIKILEKQRMNSQKDFERVKREIKILKKVKHANIIQLYQIIQTNKYYFIVMEYCSGGDLYSYILQNQRLQQKQAARIFQQLISALRYLHKLGISHRDLKPQNLLLDEDKNIKIADFGLANQYKENQGLKSFCGSPHYASPEIILQKSLTPLADVWSCGIILFAMVTGFLPFEDSNVSILYKKIILLNYEIPNFLSSLIKNLIQNILTYQQNRLTINQIQAHNFLQVISTYKNSGVNTEIYRLPVDSITAKEVSQKLNVQQSKIIQNIENNNHNQYTTYYYLLLNKKKRNGYKNICSINGSNFQDINLKKKLKQFSIHQQLRVRRIIKSHLLRQTQTDPKNQFSIEPIYQKVQYYSQNKKKIQNNEYDENAQNLNIRRMGNKMDIINEYLITHRRQIRRRQNLNIGLEHETLYI